METKHRNTVDAYFLLPFLCIFQTPSNCTYCYMIREEINRVFKAKQGHRPPHSHWQRRVSEGVWQHAFQPSNSPSSNSFHRHPCTNAPCYACKGTHWSATGNGKRLKSTQRFTQREWLNKLWQIHTKEYCIVKKKKWRDDMKNWPW